MRRHSISPLNRESRSSGGIFVRARIDGLNIEDLYQAVETLTYQDSDPTRFWVNSFMEFPTYGGDTAALTRDAQWILDMIQGHTLGALDAAQANAPLDHFGPLLGADKTGIVTLNYDQLIERVGEKFGVEVSTGAELWVEASSGTSRQQPCLF